MKIFGYEITSSMREDAIIVLAISLLNVGIGHIIQRAFDTAGAAERMEVIEQRISRIQAGDIGE